MDPLSDVLYITVVEDYLNKCYVHRSVCCAVHYVPFELKDNSITLVAENGASMTY